MNSFEIERLSMNPKEIYVQKSTVFNYNIHTHTYCEMILYMPFDGSVFVNNQRIVMDSITAIFIQPFDLHETRVDSDSGAQFIKVSFDESILTANNLPHSSVTAQQISADSYMLSTFREIHSHQNDSIYLKMLINTLVFQIVQNGEPVNCQYKTHRYVIAKKAVKIINESFTDDITLTTLAKALYVTPQYLSKVFKDTIGTGVSQYVIGIRLRYAANMLVETDYQISDICFASGFRNLSHFIRSFKKAYKVSPKHYRDGNHIPVTKTNTIGDADCWKSSREQR